MIVTHFPFAPVEETMFPPRAPFFFCAALGSAEDLMRGNLPVPPKTPPPAHDEKIAP
jgi:hypothetical protein